MIKFEVICDDKNRYNTCWKCDAFNKKVNVYSLDENNIKLCDVCLKECEQLLNSPFHLIRYISNIEQRLRRVEIRSCDHYESEYS